MAQQQSWKAEIEFINLPVLNFAMQQNHVPVIRNLSIKNTGNIDLSNIVVTIHSEPEFTTLWTQTFEHIPQGTNLDVGSIHLEISTQYLADLTERINGKLILSIAADDEVFFQQRYDIGVLPFDQWNGVAVLPEMLAAFVTPNHPEIPAIIRRAAVHLEKWTGNPSFDGYQTQNPDRVRKQMAAIFEAIAEREILYCTVPASFEDNGQRIRLTDAILSQKLGNCLDMSLLYASCLEAVGLNPLLIVVKGHAFAGGWLIEDSFTDPVNDDPSLLTKRAAEGIAEIALVESTLMNTGSRTSFDDAAVAADDRMRRTEEFVLFVDIKRARLGSIRPLPLRVATAQGWEIVPETINERSAEVPREIFAGQRFQHVDKIEVSKQLLWERKLLDLTLRNSLLNIRITKSVLQFITINPAQLEDALAEGAEFQILPKPGDWDNPLRSAGVYQSIHNTDPVVQLVQQELTQRRLRSYLSENDLDAGLTHLYRTSRTALEENGANTLYVALGLLKWFETNTSERPRFAPILLVPVEIVKKGATKGFIVRGREEETMMNVTLLEMLRQDFGINTSLQNLPKDDHGVDVQQVFSYLRQSIMAQPRWDVEEQALLGTFSFSKFILWNDIHNNADKLCENEIVASLVSGKQEWQLQPELNIANLDVQYNPAEIALPISTDSSQLEAIINAAAGKSFVLHGPPGTGKSQTITNIIANALYNGKKVLFVAAKKAALEVVQSRLAAVGLGPFCLELHSNKSKKSAVLAQLKKTTEVVRTQVPENFQSEADRLYSLRKELNDYVQALHKKYIFGSSLYDLFSAYAQLNETPTDILFDEKTLATLTEREVTQWNDHAEALQLTGSLCGTPFQHPLAGICLKQYSQQIKTEAAQLLKEYATVSDKLITAATTTAATLKFQKYALNYERLDALKNVVETLLLLPDIPASLFNVNTPEQTLLQIIQLAQHGVQRDSIGVGLLHQFQPSVFDINATQILGAWNAAAQKWFLPKWWEQRKILKMLRPLTKTGILEKDTVATAVQNVIVYQQEQRVLDSSEHTKSLGFLYHNNQCDWQQLSITCHALLRVNREVIKITGASNVKSWRNALGESFTDGSNSYLSEHRKTLSEFLQLYKEMLRLETALQNSLGIDFSLLHTTEMNVETVVEKVNRWQSNIEGLKDWYNWLQARDKAMAAGLSPIITAYENGIIKSDEVVRKYKEALYRSCAEFIIACNPLLSSFNGKLFEEKIKKFAVLSKEFEQLTKQELYARLAAKLPAFAQDAAQNSEMGILQRTIRNNGRSMSIRKLFDTIPNLLPRLHPCMLMSPISVAQYFEANNTRFDLIVFDEASQMPTCEAVGAIARGTQLIVVGDPKQLPPTSFFDINNYDESNADKEDLQSILEDCQALSMQSKHLLWHYRSKHESLIAFSNAKYYDNKLLTFPSIDDITSKVRYIPVPGFYDKGKTRQNRFEAEAIITEVVRRLSDPKLCKKSIGIVTFSSVQQNLIEDLLTEEFRKRPELERIAEDAAEPIFIKNLENVQGDERDVILFSICYGPDENGNVSLNFGPINRDGGWRRLNVAVSRARYEMLVYATLRADQIDLARTSSEGVAGLKAFLAYAEKGKTALPANATTPVNTVDNFVNVLAEELRHKGYDVHTNIGCSSYHIDMAVVDPAHPSRYLLGILTDGKNYESARTSRDREIVQTDVLKMLGWRIHKIWSAEWWENSGKVMDDIEAAINHAKSQPEIIEEETPPPAPVFKPENHTLNNAKILQPPVAGNFHDALVYEVYDVPPLRNVTSDSFLQVGNRGKVTAQIMAVLQTESPVSKNLLCKRVLTAWGISRMGKSINAHFDALIAELQIRQIAHGKNIFLWKKEHDPHAYRQYRIAKDEDQKRDADDLPPEEIANGVKAVLKHQISLPEADLVKEVSKLFGFSRLGDKVETAMITGIKTAVEKGFGVYEHGKIVLITDV